MKYHFWLFSLSLIGLFTCPLVAQEVDFSSAYIIPEITGAETETDAEETDEETIPFYEPQLHIGGVQTTNTRGTEVTIFNWILSLGFNPVSATFNVIEALPQNHFDPELLQQRLRDTVWKGEYKTSQNLYLTEFEIKSVQNGFIAGEMTHTTGENSDEESTSSSYLQAKVAGDITTQYLIDEKGDGELVWVSVARYQEIVAEISEKNEGKEGDDIIANPEILDTRHLIRLKRMRPIGDFQHASSRWGSHHEYRLTLEQGKLTGNVGTPPNSYSAQDVLTGNGQIELSREVTPETSEPVAE
jgi:hypothetical protein